MLILSAVCERTKHMHALARARVWVMCARRKRDKQRQCIASAVRKIFPAVAPLPTLPRRYLLPPTSRKIRRRKTDTSRSKVRILFPETLLSFSCLFFSVPPFLSFVFPPFFLLLLFPSPAVSRLYSALFSQPALSAKRRNHTSKL